MGCGASTPSASAGTSPVLPAKVATGQDTLPAEVDLKATQPQKAALQKTPQTAPMKGFPSSLIQPQQQPVSIGWLQSLVVLLPAPDLTGSDVAQLLLQAANARSPKRGSRSPSSSGGTPPGSGDAAAKPPPYHYVLHAASAPFANTVDMLHKHFLKLPHGRQDRKEQQHRVPASDVRVWVDGLPASVAAAQKEGGRRSSSGGGGGSGGSVGDAGPAAAAAELAELRAAVAGAASVLLVLDDEVEALSQLRCLYGLWLAGSCGRPVRVLAHDLDWDAQCQAIASLDVSAADAGGVPPALRDRMLADLLSSAATDTPAAALEPVADAPPLPPPAAAAQALRDALVSSVLEEVKPLEHSTRYHDHHDHGHETPHRVTASRPGTAASAVILNQSFATDCGGAGAASGHGRLSTTAAAISTLDRAARLLETLDRKAEAEGLSRAVLAATEAALGASHVDTLQAAANLASILGDYGKTGEAEPLLRRVLAGYERVHGLEHPDTAEAGEALGTLLQQQGRQAEAEEAFRSALAGYEASLGPEALQSLQAASHLAAVLRLRGLTEEAEVLCRRALAGYEAALGPGDPDTLGAVNNLAVLLKGAGRMEEAEPLFRRALAGCEELLGPDSAEALTAAANLAALLQAQGRLAEAEPLLRRALAGREAALGPDDPDTLGAANNLAVLLQAQGQLEAAEPLFRRALEGWDRCLGPDHTDTLTSAFNLGVVLEGLGRPAEALDMYRREAEGRGRRGEAGRAEARRERILALEAQLGGGQEEGQEARLQPLEVEVGA